MWQGGAVGSGDARQVGLRRADASDLQAIIAIAKVTGQDEAWQVAYPAYIRHLMTHGSLLVAEHAGAVTGFGATMRIGAGPQGISMLTDLFVDPASHGTGTGRALLGALWSGERRRMTFSSLHANALPLYTSFGVDAWWPLLYLRGEVKRLQMPGGWAVTPADPERVGTLERRWTGLDRTADHEFWAAWPAGAAVIASLDGRAAAAGTIGGLGAEFGLCHLALDAGTGQEPGREAVAAEAVIAVLSWLEPHDGLAKVCLPAPHPATRQLLAAGWRIEEFDLYMASEFGLIDALRLAPSPALA
jgi:GNAT superfamily N-acetyltransferase